nr:egg jelly 9-1 receptor [Apostichopus japonicus]
MGRVEGGVEEGARDTSRCLHESKHPSATMRLTVSFSYTPSRSAQVILVPALPGIGEVAAEGLTVTIYAPSPQLTDLYFDARGNTLTFRRANIVALNEDYPFPEDADSTFEMEVAAPAVVPPVRAVLFGSSTISSCGIIKVFLQSQGAAGRELTNDWSVTSEGDTSQVGDALQSLTGKDLELNGSLIDVDTDYTFSVTITNFLGGSTLASIISVDLQSPPLMSFFVLQADVFFSECVPPGATAYLWSVDNAAVVLSLKKNSRRLYVAANSLPGGTSVTFTVRAYKETVPDSYAEESKTITTLYSDLEAVIAQGQFITVGRDSGDLELDGSLSYDPDNEAIDATYEWLCEQFDRDMAREQITDNTACWSYKSGHTGETVLTNANPTDSILTFDAAHLGASKIYFFTLTVRKGLRTATSSIFVSPVAGAPPKVSIAPLTGAVSSDEVLSIKATILHTTALSEVTWSTTDTDSEYSYVDVTDPTNFITRPTTLQVSDEETFSFMTFDKNILVPGSTYRFNLEVATEDNKTSNATVEVRIRSIVTSCMAGLVDGATSYTELQTITIGVDSCTTDTDAYPLTYQLLMASSEEIYTAITSSESSDRISVTGAPATFISSSNAFNNFRVKVCNSYDSCSEFDFTLTVVAAEFTEAEVASAVENLVDLEEQKQLPKALTNFNILVLRLGGEQVTNSIGTNVRRRRAVDTTSDANTKTLDLGRKWMDNSDMGTREAEVLINEMSNFKTRESSQADMETLVDQFQETVDIFTENGESIPESSSELLLQKLEEIKREVPSSASRIRGKISTLSDDSIKTLYHSLSLGGGERKKKHLRARSYSNAIFQTVE